MSNRHDGPEPAIVPFVGRVRPTQSVAAPFAVLSHFELGDRLVQAWIRNGRRLEHLETLDSRIDAARRRLDATPAGRELVSAYLDRLLAKRDSCLERYRADRRLMNGLLRESETRRGKRKSDRATGLDRSRLGA